MKMRIGEGLRRPFVSIHQTAAVPSRHWLVHQPHYHVLSHLNRQIWQQNSRGREGAAMSQLTGTNTNPL